MQEYPKHYCGVFGIYGHPNAAKLTYYGLTFPLGIVAKKTDGACWTNAFWNRQSGGSTELGSARWILFSGKISTQVRPSECNLAIQARVVSQRSFGWARSEVKCS